MIFFCSLLVTVHCYIVYVLFCVFLLLLLSMNPHSQTCDAHKSKWSAFPCCETFCKQFFPSQGLLVGLWAISLFCPKIHIQNKTKCSFLNWRHTALLQLRLLNAWCRWPNIIVHICCKKHSRENLLHRDIFYISAHCINNDQYLLAGLFGLIFIKEERQSCSHH